MNVGFQMEVVNKYASIEEGRILVHVRVDTNLPLITALVSNLKVISILLSF